MQNFLENFIHYLQMLEFPTQVKGQPCFCRVLSYEPAEPMLVTGSGYGDAEPPEEAEFCFLLVDDDGKPMSQLQYSMKLGDFHELMEEAKIMMEGDYYEPY